MCEYVILFNEKIFVFMCGFSVNTQTLLPDNKMSIFCFSEGLIIIGDMKSGGKVLEKRLFVVVDFEVLKNYFEFILGGKAGINKI